MRNKRTSRLFNGDSPVVVPFLTAGFPSKRVFLECVLAAYEAGAAAIEIGMPFSDPLADGPAIQHSSQSALDSGITTADVFELTSQLRAKISIPILLMGYLNPLLKAGMTRFAEAAAFAGADGTIIPDCPIEEAGDWIDASEAAGLDNVFLVAPTSPDERVKRIDRLSTSFSYCVSVAGVTGARRDVSDATKSYLRRVRGIAKKPYVVGFGIASPTHIKALSGLADGFVIGSALVGVIENGTKTTASKRVGRLIASLVRAAQPA
jgi:tryptophan synthase alpha chain